MTTEADEICQHVEKQIASAERCGLTVTHVWVPRELAEEAQRQFPGLIVRPIEPSNDSDDD